MEELMGKKTIFGLLLFTLIAIPLFAVCAPAPAPTPSPTTAAPTTPVAPKVIELKVAATVPEMAPPGKALGAWTKAMEEQSNGRLKFTIFWTSSLFEAKEGLPSMKAGIADLSELHVQALPGAMAI